MLCSGCTVVRQSLLPSVPRSALALMDACRSQVVPKPRSCGGLADEKVTQPARFARALRPRCRTPCLLCRYAVDAR
jgi:hypothetical protein